MGISLLAGTKRTNTLRVVNNHIIGLYACRFIPLRNTAKGVQEETIAELHDVSLVHASHFLDVNVSKDSTGNV